MKIPVTCENCGRKYDSVTEYENHCFVIPTHSGLSWEHVHDCKKYGKGDENE
jgi:hypothetical protein